jgi:hypothetical protein
MWIQPKQDEVIRTKFANYDKQKSEVIWEFGNFSDTNCSGEFIAKIYRKGKFRFSVSNGKVTSIKKLE